MSGRKFSFEVTKTSSAPAATLFRLVTDGGNWATWAKPIVAQSSWARRGDPAPGGIGAIRKLGMWPVFVQEETVSMSRTVATSTSWLARGHPSRTTSARWSLHQMRRAVPISAGVARLPKRFVGRGR